MGVYCCKDKNEEISELDNQTNYGDTYTCNHDDISKPARRVGSDINALVHVITTKEAHVFSN